MEIGRIAPLLPDMERNLMRKKNFGIVLDNSDAQNPQPFPVDVVSELSVDLDELLLSVKEDSSNPFKVPFPQANDLDKVLDIIVFFDEKGKTTEQISSKFKFHDRQGDYYANAAIFLGFLERNHENAGSFILTGLGREIKRCSTQRCRKRILFVQMLKKPVLRSAIVLLKHCNYDLNKVTIESLVPVIRENYSKYTRTTSRRRASTVLSWIKWICANFNFKS
ncbi:DUF7226 domain-containing protein [Methanolacinia petrolearia]|uniref:DUF7226 domain-containing protein n=1 Tax=Methanolacinia petrolearia TaxID=54120 RepID=UPI003BAC1D4B